MRISDWSSDVCSSDLGQVSTGNIAESYAKDYAEKFGAGALLTGLDRDAEYRSHQAAEVYLVRSGFNPLALYAVLQKMTAFGTKSASMPQLHRTPPPLEDRPDRMDRDGVPGLHPANPRHTRPRSRIPTLTQQATTTSADRGWQ